MFNGYFSSHNILGNSISPLNQTNMWSTEIAIMATDWKSKPTIMKLGLNI